MAKPTTEGDMAIMMKLRLADNEDGFSLTENEANNQTTMTVTQLNPILKVLLTGVYDKESDLYALNGASNLVKHIWRILVKYWKGCIEAGQKSYKAVKERRDDVVGHMGYFLPNFRDYGFINHNTVEFPKPTDININMMPFMASEEFKYSCLPDKYEDYWNKLIEPCLRSQYELRGKICYLTIQESFVEENTSQRRPGIHTETPGVITLYTSDEEESESVGKTDAKKGAGSSERTCDYFHWGGGHFSHDYPRGGIYMASSVDYSCRIWNYRIVRDESGNEIIGEHGDISHLKQFFDQGEMLKKNKIYWFTDRTPHESLPLRVGTYRQFFRLVTDNVTAWFKDHSTANPKGLLPDPSITKIVSGSKFDGGKLVIVN